MTDRMLLLILGAADAYATGRDPLQSKWLRNNQVSQVEQIELTDFIVLAIREKLAATTTGETK